MLRQIGWRNQRYGDEPTVSKWIQALIIGRRNVRSVGFFLAQPRR